VNGFRNWRRVSDGRWASTEGKKWTWPQIGDTTKNLWPQHYATLAKVLKKIQIKEHWGIIQKKRGAMDNETMKEWLFRFDGK
jgi:hypothetical protein